MKRVYLNFYEFVWFWVSKHCLNMFNHTPNKHKPVDPTEIIWIEELASIVQHKFEKCRERHCYIKLFKAYVFAVDSLKNIRHEEKLRKANDPDAFSDEWLMAGKYVLAILLLANTLIGLWITYTYQVINGFNVFSSLIAVITYMGVAWCVFEARALPYFKLSLIFLFTLTSFNTLFWSLWQAVSTSSSCYSEVCALIHPDSFIQHIEIKLPLLLFWISFLLLLSPNTPIHDYLIRRESLNRKL